MLSGSHITQYTFQASVHIRFYLLHHSVWQFEVAHSSAALTELSNVACSRTQATHLRISTEL